MVETLALDSLLILILLLLIPIGLYRGGLREACSAAGVLLGLIVAQHWADRWGGWVANASGIDVGVSRFMVAVTVLVLFAGLIGYAAAAAFSYSPGPGGRLYGGLIALASGVLFLGALIQFVATYLYDGVYPDLIRQGYVSRALSVGFDWVLLAVSAFILVATVLGMIVRERETDEIMIDLPHDPVASVRRPAPAPTMAPEPINLAPARSDKVDQEETARTSAVRIREVRHWEEPTPPTMQDLQSGWTRTWPSSVTPEVKGSPGPRRAGADARTPRSSTPARRGAQTSEEATIRDWLAEDQGANPRRERIDRPVEDE